MQFLPNLVVVFSSVFLLCCEFPRKRTHTFFHWLYCHTEQRVSNYKCECSRGFVLEVALFEFDGSSLLSNALLNESTKLIFHWYLCSLYYLLPLWMIQKKMHMTFWNWEAVVRGQQIQSGVLSMVYEFVPATLKLACHDLDYLAITSAPWSHCFWFNEVSIFRDKWCYNRPTCSTRPPKLNSYEHAELKLQRRPILACFQTSSVQV